MASWSLVVPAVEQHGGVDCRALQRALPIMIFLAYDEFAASDSVASTEHMFFAMQWPGWVLKHAGSRLLQALLA